MRCAESLSCVQLFGTSWAVARQAPLSMGIFQARIPEWVALPSSGDLLDPGIEPMSPVVPALQVDSLLLSHRRSWEGFPLLNNNFDV